MSSRITSPTGTGLAFDGTDDRIDLGPPDLPGTWTVSFWGRMDRVQKWHLKKTSSLPGAKT